MKKSVLLAVVALFGFASAQINLLHTFNEAVFPLSEEFEFVGNLQFLDFAGYINHYDERTIRVYNEDFSLKAAIVAPEGFDGHVAAVSQRVFDLDDRLEYLAYLGDWEEDGEILRLYNESGHMLKDFGRVRNAVLYTTSNKEYRLMILRGNWNTMRFTTEIYGLPGRGNIPTSTSSPATRRTAELAYNLRPGETATMEIFDVKGRLIETKKIDHTFSKVLLNTTNYARGTYVYRVNGMSKKFMVR